MRPEQLLRGEQDESWPERPSKRRKVLGRTKMHTETSVEARGLGSKKIAVDMPQGCVADDNKHKSNTIASTAKLASQAVAPFLARHVPEQYAPLGGINQRTLDAPKDPNSRFCYRHRPDVLCRRQADESSMDKLQKGLETVSEDDRQGIAHVWSLFSAAPAKHRNLMLQGILAQCCFPQLSYLSANVKDLIRIDFLSALPAELSFRILCFLDTPSLCKAAQVSRRWRQLADDDVVWHRMCEQHIDRKCTRCGWGLPLLERKRLRASKRQIQLRATGRGPDNSLPGLIPFPEAVGQDIANGVIGEHSLAESSVHEKSNNSGRLSPIASKKRPAPLSGESELARKTRPWKDVYKDRFKVGTNWKYGRCSTKIFTGHKNGVMCLQFYDNILATGSYDATIKIWDIQSGKELRTLRGHTMGVRCLQFDDTKLISGSLDHNIKIWNWRTGECLSTCTSHTGGVISVHFDSNIMVSGSVDKTAVIWNFRDKSTWTLRGHTDWVNSVRIDSASRTVFTASDDFTIRLWDLDTKKCIRIFEGHVGQVQQVLPLPREFELEDDDLDYHSDDSRHSNTSAVDRSSPELTHRILSPPSTQYTDAFNCQGDRPAPPRYIVTTSLDSTIRMWDVTTGRCIRKFFGHVEGVWAVAADTLRIVTGAEDQTVKVWDPRTGNCDRTFTGHLGPVTCVGLSDSRMCSGGEDGDVRMYCFFKTDGMSD